MRWFLDTEFQEDGRVIDLISLGLINEAGDQTYYGHSSEYDPNACDEWVQKNVLPYVANVPRKPRSEIAADVKKLLLEQPGPARNSHPEIWAFFNSTDWVAFYQLFGRMLELPKGMPHICFDLKQEMVRLGVTMLDLPESLLLKNRNAHDCLADARWDRDVFLWLRDTFPTTHFHAYANPRRL